MAKWRVEYRGEREVEADSELEAECNAAFDCSPDNCRATLIEGDENNILEECEEPVHVEGEDA